MPRPITHRCPCTVALATLLWAVAPLAAQGVDDPKPAAAAPDEEEFTLEGPVGTDDEDRSIWEAMGENLRINVDILARVGTSRNIAEPEFLGAVGLDLHKVFSDSEGDIGTLLLQPYVVRRDNALPRPIDVNGDDAFSLELHDFYFNLTRFGGGKTNLKVGHFDVPFGLEPRTDTHFTLYQIIPLHDVGFKKDWGVSINGTFPEFDYEVSLTTGTGMDLTGLGADPYLVAGRIGTPSEANRVLGLSALYGEVIDEHGLHRLDEINPDRDQAEEREAGLFVRRLRVGMDYTEIVGQFGFKAEISGGRDFEQSVFNTIAEVNWTTRDEHFTAYWQWAYLGQESHVGWDENVLMRLGLKWMLHAGWSLSAQWIHDFYWYVEHKGGVHTPDDTFHVQLRWTF